MNGNTEGKYFVVDKASGKRLTKAIPMEEAEKVIKKKLEESKDAPVAPELVTRQYLAE